MSPNALVDRSKLKLEGKKNLSKYLLKTGKERFQSKYTVFRNALFLDSQFSYLLASLRFAQLKPELKIQKEKKKKPNFPPTNPSSTPEVLISLGWVLGPCPQKCHCTPRPGLHRSGVAGAELSFEVINFPSQVN